MNDANNPFALPPATGRFAQAMSEAAEEPKGLDLADVVERESMHVMLRRMGLDAFLRPGGGNTQWQPYEVLTAPEVTHLTKGEVQEAAVKMSYGQHGFRLMLQGGKVTRYFGGPPPESGVNGNQGQIR